MNKEELELFDQIPKDGLITIYFHYDRTDNRSKELAEESCRDIMARTLGQLLLDGKQRIIKVGRPFTKKDTEPPYESSVYLEAQCYYTKPVYEYHQEGQRRTE